MGKIDSTNSAILLISCPDRKGIVAAVSAFLYQHGANILHADEHRDDESGLFFMRVEWDLADFRINKLQFNKRFLIIAKEFKMQWNIEYTKNRINLAVFVSKENHCLADLLYRYQSGELKCRIRAVISNHLNAQNW